MTEPLGRRKPLARRAPCLSIARTHARTQGKHEKLTCRVLHFSLCKDARDPASNPSDPTYVKIGGILSTCSYASGSYNCVLGVGINTSNPRPTTSLDALLPEGLAPFRLEKLLARILTRLESLHSRFLREGFSRTLETSYYRNWLHSGQKVTLEAEGGVKARITGITRDWGMLKAVEIDEVTGQETGKTWALQSDENSFDFWRGLVRRKL